MEQRLQVIIIRYGWKSDGVSDAAVQARDETGVQALDVKSGVRVVGRRGIK